MGIFGDGFDAVVFFWIVAGGDVGGGIKVKFRRAGGKIHHGGNAKADVYRFDACVVKSLHESFLQCGAGQSAVSSDAHVFGGVFLFKINSSGFSDDVDAFFGEVGWSGSLTNCDATNVVGAENVGVEHILDDFLHGGILLCLTLFLQVFKIAPYFTFYRVHAEKTAKWTISGG